MPITFPMGEISLSEAIKSLAIAKAASNRRPVYVTHLRMCLAAFTEHAGDVSIQSITTDHVEAFLATRGCNPWTRMTYTARLSTLFEFSRRRRWITENPCFFLERVSVDQSPPRILTPDEAHRLVGICSQRFPRGLGWLALTLFAGLRPEEAACIEWSKIDDKNRRIWVDSKVSKVRRMRIVEPMGCTFRLLANAKDLGAELPLPLTARRRIMRQLRDAMGWSIWPKDITRHTCASYWLSLAPDAGRLALQLGNSASILLRHYRCLTTPEVARSFFCLSE